MKTTSLIALALLLTACGDNSGNDTAEPPGGEDTSNPTDASREAPQPRSFEAERIAPEAATARNRGSLGRLAPANGTTGARVGSAPEGRTAIQGQRIQTVEPTAPRLAPLPAEPTDEDLSVLTISTDTGADGTIDRVQRSYFDARSNRVMLEEDRDGDGVFEIVEVFFYTYDEGRLTRIETDADADGSINKLEVRTYNALGRALMIERDDDGDGAWDRIERNTWDDDGRRTEWAVDAPVDGQPDMVQRWTFGPDGRSHARSLDRFSNGEHLNTTTYDHAFDDDGRVVSMNVTGPTALNTIHREYDDKGRLSATHTDTGRDGIIDNHTMYTYDDQGRLVKLEINAGPDGKPSTIIHRDYDNFPRPSSAGGCP